MFARPRRGTSAIGSCARCCAAAALALVLLVVGMVAEMLLQAATVDPGIRPRFFYTSTWDPVAERFGRCPVRLRDPGVFAPGIC